MLLLRNKATTEKRINAINMISRIPRQNYLDAHSFFLFVHSGRPGCGENYETLLSYLKVAARAKELSLGGKKMVIFVEWTFEL